MSEIVYMKIVTKDKRKWHGNTEVPQCDPDNDGKFANCQAWCDNASVQRERLKLCQVATTKIASFQSLK